MIHKKIFLLLLALSMMPTCLSAHSRDTSYQEYIEGFFTRFDKGEYNEAIDYIYSSNPWINLKSDQIAKLRNAFSNLPSLVGAPSVMKNLPRHSLPIDSSIWITW